MLKSRNPIRDELDSRFVHSRTPLFSLHSVHCVPAQRGGSRSHRRSAPQVMPIYCERKCRTEGFVQLGVFGLRGRGGSRVCPGGDFSGADSNFEQERGAGTQTRRQRAQSPLGAMTSVGRGQPDHSRVVVSALVDT